MCLGLRGNQAGDIDLLTLWGNSVPGRSKCKFGVSRRQAGHATHNELEATWVEAQLAARPQFLDAGAVALCRITERLNWRSGCTLTVDGGLKDAFPR